MKRLSLKMATLSCKGLLGYGLILRCIQLLRRGVNGMATKKGGKGGRGGNKSTPGKIVALVEWNKRPFLDKMIDDETPVKDLVAWCKDNGFYISLPTMYTYMKQRREGVINNLTNELLQPKTEDSLRKALEEASKKGGEQNKLNRHEDRARAK